MNNRWGVITGAAVVCSLGYHLNTVVESILLNKTQFSKVPFKTEWFKDRQVALVSDANPRDIVDNSKSLRYMSREAQLAVSALILCMKDAGLYDSIPYDQNETALFSGTGSSGIQLDSISKFLSHAYHPETGQFDLERFGNQALYKINPLTSFQILPNMPPALSAIIADIKGANLVFNPWEGNALLAVYEALWEIHSNRAKLVFCGGSDCKTHSNAFITFYEYGLLTQSDVVMSEGSAFLAIEAPETGRYKDKDIYCVIRYMYHESYVDSRGYSHFHSPDVYDEMIRTTIMKSCLQPMDIDLVISSCDFTHLHDQEEERILKKYFSCPMISPKKNIGNTYAAAGIINMAVGAEILKNKHKVQGKEISRILITSFAPGSEKFCIILEKP